MPARAARLLLICGLIAAASPAYAQFGGGGGRRGGGSGGAGGGAQSDDTALAPMRLLPPERPRPLPWPRLDTGAVICRTLDELRQRAQVVSHPEQHGEVPPGCQTVLKMVPVSVISRSGPGATQVRVEGPGREEGWTDAWLPDRPSQRR